MEGGGDYDFASHGGRIGVFLLGVAFFDMVLAASASFTRRSAFLGLAVAALCLLGGAVQAAIVAFGSAPPLEFLSSKGNEAAYQMIVRAANSSPDLFPRLLFFLGAVVHLVLSFPMLKGALAARRLLAEN